MKTIVTTLKESYSRDIRKQLVKATLASEKNDDKESLALQSTCSIKSFRTCLKSATGRCQQTRKSGTTNPLKL